MKSLNVRRLVRCGLVSALYITLCLVFQPLSFGPVQLRFAEALALLPVFGSEYIIAVTLGCLLSNMLLSTLPDVIFGTAATLLSCLVTYQLRNKRIHSLALPAAIPPILFNGLIVGPEITIFFSAAAPTLSLMFFNGLTVAAGQLVACGVLGVALVRLIEVNPALNRLFISERK